MTFRNTYFLIYCYWSTFEYQARSYIKNDEDLAQLELQRSIIATCSIDSVSVPKQPDAATGSADWCCTGGVCEGW